jgi:phospholipase/carboxylesterase
VLLHGAGGAARRVIDNNRARAEEFGVIVLAPESRGMTWDIVRGEFGEDVRFIDRALDRLFTDYLLRSV